MLSRYGRLGASSRMRFYQYLPWLEAAGISITAAPLFSDGYVRGLQQNTKNLFEAARAYAGRVQALLGSRQFDLLWIEKEALPWLPAWFEKALLSGAVPYVLDYDDAVFHYYDQHRHPVVRALLGGKHPALIQRAALVVAGNAYLARRQYHGLLTKPKENDRPCASHYGSEDALYRERMQALEPVLQQAPEFKSSR